MKWNTIVRTLSVGSILAATAVTAQAEIVLKHSNWFPEGQVMRVNVIEPWKDEVERATEGRVRIETMPKVVGSVQGQYDVARDGQADLVVFSNGYTPGRFDILELGELPFLGDRPDIFGPALHRFYTKHVAQYGEYRDVVPLSVFVVAPPELFNNQRKIESIEDFDGLKIRSNSRGTTELLKLLGAVPVSRPATETYELMSSGVLDGTVMPPESIPAFNLVEASEYALITPGALTNSILTLAINEDTWNRISPKDREAIRAISGETFARQIGEAYLPGNEAAWDALREAGQSVHTASPELLADMEEALEPLIAAWAERAGARGVENPEALLQALRDEVEAVENGR